MGRQFHGCILVWIVLYSNGTWETGRDKKIQPLSLKRFIQEFEIQDWASSSIIREQRNILISRRHQATRKVERLDVCTIMQTQRDRDYCTMKSGNFALNHHLKPSPLIVGSLERVQNQVLISLPSYTCLVYLTSPIFLTNWFWESPEETKLSRKDIWKF